MCLPACLPCLAARLALPACSEAANYQTYTKPKTLNPAVKLNYQTSDIVINWAGGLHHAKKSEASGGWGMLGGRG